MRNVLQYWLNDNLRIRPVAHIAGKHATSPRALAPRTLGLENLRASRGVSLEDIADKTKISMRFLRAIEEEEFGKLPGGIFATSYLRQYAAAVGYDEADLISYYERKSGRYPEPAIDTPSGSRSGFLRWLRA